MSKTLTHRLDDACASHGLEWLILPFDESPEAWRGPYWSALVLAQYSRRAGYATRFYRYNGTMQIPQYKRPEPDVVYLSLEPLGRHESKLLLLAQIT